MRHALTLLVLPALLASPCTAASKSFKETSDFRKEQKGYLNVKFDTYAHMLPEPKGTDCDWVFVDPSFNLDDLRKSTVSFFPDSIGRGGDWGTYWGLAMGWYANPLSTSFEASLNTQGVRLSPVAKKDPASYPMNPYAAMMGARPPQETPTGGSKQPELSDLQKQIERDRYEEDKKNLGVEEAAKRAEAREAKRLSDWSSKKAVEEKPKNPEETPGYVLVLYLTESKVNTGTAWIPFVPVTNTTTGEFILMKDGKPVLAGRHNSVGAYSSSAPKCGEALGTAFKVMVQRAN
jgi:hypothetical protein